jgi:hypothetical protein
MIGKFNGIDRPDFITQTLQRKNRGAVSRMAVNYM